MLFNAEPRGPLTTTPARALLEKQPRVMRVTRAWMDDAELCLEVECRLSDGETTPLQMLYSWERKYQHAEIFFAALSVQLLNGEWVAFYEFVQKRFMEELADHATNPAYPQDGED
jgi:hypothetical protein